MIAIDQFKMAPEQNGMMLSYIGAISLFMQGIGIATLTTRYSDKTLMGLSTTTLTISYFVLVRSFIEKCLIYSLDYFDSFSDFD